MYWLSLLIPVIFILLSLLLSNKRDNKIIYTIPLFISFIIIVTFSEYSKSSQTYDTEYFGNYITEVRRYEEWDEYIHQTCSRRVYRGTDSKGNAQYDTEYYDCSYVRHHSEEYEALLNNNQKVSINYDYWKRCVNNFSTPSIFVELNRHYHRIDGDMYYNAWPGTKKNVEFYGYTKSYVNKIQASPSIFNFREISEKEKIDYKLYEYPNILKNNKIPAILHPKNITISNEDQINFDWVNGLLGSDKKIRVWVLLFDQDTKRAAELQEAYWKGGNKNELVICTGIDKDLNVKWSYIFGWSKKSVIKINVRNYLDENKSLDFNHFSDFLFKEINDNWLKRSFKEFDYLNIEPSFISITSIWILVIITSVSFFIINHFHK